VTKLGSVRVTNRVTGAQLVTRGAAQEVEKPVACGAEELFFGVGRGMKIVTVSVEV
jgi:hypothetical protein